MLHLKIVRMPRAWHGGMCWAFGGPAGEGSRSRRWQALAQGWAELRRIEGREDLVVRAADLGRQPPDNLAHFDPGTWADLDARDVAAAYGVRYVELVTGRNLDLARPLPLWLREWTPR